VKEGPRRNEIRGNDVIGEMAGGGGGPRGFDESNSRTKTVRTTFQKMNQI